MKVTDIDIIGLQYDPGQDRHEGLVSMELRPELDGAEPMNVQFLCHSGLDRGAPDTLITYDLIKDALRQAHRMPGFRRGESRIEVEVSRARIESRIASA